jgi:hypothetical protein
MILRMIEPAFTGRSYQIACAVATEVPWPF